MKTNTFVEYECELCGDTFDNPTDCTECESRPITQDKGVKPGDRVKILTGDGCGQVAVVEQMYPLTRDACHHMWQRYWHTIAITVVFSDGRMRWCTFDEYEVLQ